MSLAGKHYLAALIWSLLLGALYLFLDGRIQPKVATTTGNTLEIVIPRSPDGHFYVAGGINGQQVTFMVDTGASTVAINAAIARRIGLPRGREVAVSTAGGGTRGEEVTGQTISIGGITIRDARILVLADMSAGAALLGQNVLRHLEITQSPEQMILRTGVTARSGD